MRQLTLKIPKGTYANFSKLPMRQLTPERG